MQFLIRIVKTNQIFHFYNKNLNIISHIAINICKLLLKIVYDFFTIYIEGNIEISL